MYANLWYVDEIIKINLASGKVTEKIPMARLYPKAR